MSPYYKLSEEDLVSLLLARDQKSFNYLYDNYSGALYSVILRIVTSDIHAQEVIQDAFLKIWRNITSYDAAKGRLYTWMVNITRNCAIDYLKTKGYQNEQKNQSITNFVTDDMGFTSPDQLNFIGMKNVLSQLKTEWQVLINLAYYQGFTQQEIAEKLEIPLGTVKTRTRNALAELKLLLKDYN